jgi:hypothetical protein
MGRSRQPFLAGWGTLVEGAVLRSTRITEVKGETSDEPGAHQYPGGGDEMHTLSAGRNCGEALRKPMLAKWQVEADGVVVGSTYFTKATGETSDDR